MRLLIVLSASFLVACAATYSPPTIAPVDITMPAPAGRAELVRAARQVLASEGFQIASSDEASGVVSTLPRTVRVSPEAAHCGSNAGVDNAYLKDTRTQSRLAINVLAADRKLTVRANVDADYRPGSSMQDMTLTCISKGALERALADKIIATSRR